MPGRLPVRREATNCKRFGFEPRERQQSAMLLQPLWVGASGDECVAAGHGMNQCMTALCAGGVHATYVMDVSAAQS
eukprot:3633369-Prymnesium_polylepis.1